MYRADCWSTKAQSAPGLLRGNPWEGAVVLRNQEVEISHEVAVNQLTNSTNLLPSRIYLKNKTLVVLLTRKQLVVPSRKIPK